jgi:RNA polymerase sigma factor (TIGR02999 family)
VNDTTAKREDITLLLNRAREGDKPAMDEAFALLYPVLKGIAQRKMARERQDHTLDATSLLNEAYLQLYNAKLDWGDRAHFSNVAARVMRNVLIDHARSKRSQKRGGDMGRVTLMESQLGAADNPDVLDLDEALKHLGEFDERKAKVIELHFFGGLSYREIAEALEISPATVDRELRMGKAWLTRELSSLEN